MKIFIKILLFVVSIAVFFACQNNQQISNIASNTSDKQTYKAVGVIKKIDAPNGKITIAHEDIGGYMSAMEMNESVKDKSTLEAVKIGDKVDFEIERTGEKIIITKIAKIGEVAVLNGSEIYKTNCVKCHGDTGEGAKKGIPLISGHALNHSESEYIEQVLNGESNKMPAFKDELTNEQIAEVVRFVREELQKNVSKEERSEHHH